ncbi:MAG: class I SAM-dependent methyltransferase [Candidatus Aminicenantes bacterium]|jgi:SAM-dependent methyltransferase
MIYWQIFLGQAVPSNTASGNELIDWIKALAPIIGAVIAVLGVGLTAYVTIRRGVLDKRYEYASSILEFRIRQIMEFYAPMQILIEKSRLLYEKLIWAMKRTDKNFDKKNFRLLDHISRLDKDEHLKSFIDAIIETGNKMSDLIIDKGGLIEGGITQTYIDYQAHLEILKTAKIGKTSIKQEAGWQQFGYYPKLLNREVREGYKSVLEYIRSYIESGDKLIFKVLDHHPEFTNFFNERKKLFNTLLYYEQNVEEYAEEFDGFDFGGIYLNFENMVKQSKNKDYPPYGSILDAGCGTGRDTAKFIKDGFQVTAFDASPAMVRKCNKEIDDLKRNSDTKIAEIANSSKCLEMTFDEVNFRNEFTGVWASASLLHIPQYRLESTINKLIKSLKRGGTIYISLKYGKRAIELRNRQFYYYKAYIIKKILRKIEGLKVVEIWLTNKNAEEVKRPWYIIGWRLDWLWRYNKGEYWLNVMLKKEKEF